MVSQERHTELNTLQSALGYTFKDVKLLNKALTHKSYVNEKSEPLKNNERFEFLGDSVLDLIVSDFMVKKYTDFPEGILSKIRAAVVNETCLAELARKNGLGQYLLLGKGEHLSGGRDKNSLLANAYEALAGAIYSDSDLDTVHRVLLSDLAEKIEALAESAEFRDYKSELQEYTQNQLGCIPMYKVTRETGPDHNKRFEVEVLIRHRSRGSGLGRSKKEAEQAAAHAALEIFRETDST